MIQHRRWLPLFLLDNSILWIGMMVVNIATYASQIFVARMLGQEQFGAFVAVVSLTNLLFLATGSLQTIVARQAAHMRAQQRVDGLVTLIRHWLGKLALLGMVVGLVVLFLGQWIARLFHLDSIVPVLMMAPVAVAGFCLPVPRGVWQGTQNFLRLSANLSVEGISRLVLVVVITVVTMSGAIAATSYGLAALIALLFAFFTRTRSMGSGETDNYQEIDPMTRPILVAGISLMLLINIDVLAVRHFLGEYDAGIYATVVFVGRIAIFAAATVPIVMLPKVVHEQTSGARARSIFLVSIGLILIVCGACLVIPVTFPNQFTALIFGQAFEMDRGLVLAGGVAATLFALVSAFVSLYFAMGCTRVERIMVATALLEFALLGVFHDSVMTVIAVTIGTLLISLAIFVFDLLRSNQGLLMAPCV